MKKTNLVAILTIFILLLGIATQVSAQGCVDVSGRPIPCPTATPDGGNDTGRHDVPDDSDGDGTADPLDACPTVPGDGANRGCPLGTDPDNPNPDNVSPAISPAFVLDIAPVSDDCLVSPEGSQGVNIRIAPNPTADIIHVLQPNEWAKVWAIVYEGHNPLRAEHEFGGDEYEPVLDVLVPDPDAGPDPVLSENDSLWLLIQTDDNYFGWVAEAVIRKSGDCAEFVLPPNDPEWLELMFLPNDGGGVGFPGPDGFLKFPFIPDPPPGFQFDLRIPDEEDDDTLEFAPECVVTDLGNSGSILDCAGSAPIFTYCLTNSDGEETCYEVEIPDGCTITTDEPGVWKFDCEEGSGVGVTPFGSDNPIFSAGDNEDAISLLLPAVQSAREAARRG